jgi:hypothetical protein
MPHVVWGEDIVVLWLRPPFSHDGSRSIDAGTVLNTPVEAVHTEDFQVFLLENVDG